MEIGRILRLVAAPIVLALIALGSWRSADNSDFEAVSGTRFEYEAAVDSPMLSARRIPQTLQAPVSDDILATTLSTTIDRYPDESCLTVMSGDRLLTPSSTIPGGLIPASNQKLVTTFAALQTLGPDFRFTTTVQTAATVEDGVLDGDLYIVGGGDPFLGTDDWQSQYDDVEARSRTRLEDLADSAAAALAAEGVTEIGGAVIGDESFLDSERYGPWRNGLITQNQSGPLSALTVNEGFVDWPETYLGTPRPRSQTDDPPRYAAEQFTDLLRARGLIVNGAAAAGVTQAGARLVAEVSSPDLVATVTHINTHSSNLGAELLLKRLGRDTTGEGSTAGGAEAVRRVLGDLGVPMTDVVINDGSGLAESNRLTCDALVAVLTFAGRESALADSLAVAGERGTLRERFKATPIAGQVHAKTGSLSGVRALSGFADSTVDDDALTFSYIINDPGLAGDVEIQAQEPLLLSLIRYPEGPSVEELSPRPARQR
ncbi:MAG: D-alanyl-D-alanine carboxypeptidase/D-alanyl-D-alanine-endopeptidase [Acidimicrobiia bacterium]|nr:D-alanyl-D-alanine carboxypeptidase/D-alanyl-D-alanine-endopeptidase [Acidimicrobiia bacterium]